MDEKVLEHKIKSSKNVFDLYYLNEAEINDTNIADERDGKYVDIDNYGNFKRMNKRKNDVRENFCRKPKETIMRDRRFDGMEVSKIHSFSNGDNVYSRLCVDVKQSKRQCCVRVVDPNNMVMMQF